MSTFSDKTPLLRQLSTDTTDSSVLPSGNIRQSLDYEWALRKAQAELEAAEQSAEKLSLAAETASIVSEQPMRVLQLPSLKKRAEDLRKQLAKKMRDEHRAKTTLSARAQMAKIESFFGKDVSQMGQVDMEAYVRDLEENLRMLTRLEAQERLLESMDDESTVHEFKNAAAFMWGGLALGGWAMKSVDRKLTSRIHTNNMSAQLAAAQSRLQLIRNAQVAEDERERARRREEERKKRELAALLQELPSTLDIPVIRKDTGERSKSPLGRDRSTLGNGNGNGVKRKAEDYTGKASSDDGLDGPHGGTEKKRKVMSFAELMAMAKQTTPDELRVVVEDHTGSGVKGGVTGDVANGDANGTDGSKAATVKKARSMSLSPVRKLSTRPSATSSSHGANSIKPSSSSPALKTQSLAPDYIRRPNSSLALPNSRSTSPALSSSSRTSSPGRNQRPGQAASRLRAPPSQSNHRSRTPVSRNVFYQVADLATPIIARPRDLRSVDEVLEDKKRARMAESGGTGSGTDAAGSGASSSGSTGGGRVGGSLSSLSAGVDIRLKRTSPERTFQSRPVASQSKALSSSPTNPALTSARSISSRPPSLSSNKPVPHPRYPLPHQHPTSTHRPSASIPTSSGPDVPEWRKLLDAVTGGYRGKFQGREELDDDADMEASRTDIDREERRSRMIAKREDELEEERERREREAKARAKREREKLGRSTTKAKNLKNAGSPIKVGGKVLSLVLVENDIFVAESSGIVRRLNQDGTTKATLKGHKGPVTCIAIEKDVQSEHAVHAWTGSWDKSIIKWDLNTNSPVLTLTHHSDFVKSVLFIPATQSSAAFLVSSSSDSTIRYFTPAGESIRVIKEHTRSVESLCIDENCEYLYSGSSDTTIRKWLLQTGQEVALLKGHDTSVYWLWWDAGSGSLWSASADKTARRWDVEKSIVDLTFEHPDFVKAVVLDPTGKYLFTGGRDQNIRVWDVASEQLLTVIEGHFDEVSALVCVGTTLWSASLDGTVRRWGITEPDIRIFISQTESSLELDTHVEKCPKATAPKVEEANLSGRSTVTGHSIELTEEEERELAELMN
ncbi:hypothetical protein HDU93_000176 [Gonapodya sp. JEL0774]|nr:hypothetical protein HDU93_000176 [Gonapodya sp. JEL0774]